MAITTPANVDFCKVTGQLVYSDLQPGDVDGKPNLEPFANKWIKFTPTPSKMTDLTASPRALTIAPKATLLYTNDEGIIIGDPTPTNLWGWILASADTHMNPTGWNYKVEFQDDLFPVVYTIAPVNGTIEIASVIDTVANSGVVVTALDAAVAAAASSASAAATSAASINRGGANGVAPLDASSKVPLANMPSGVGGATTLSGITDMSTNARTFNAAADYAAMRTALGVGTGSLAIGVTTGTAADGGVVAGYGTRITAVEGVNTTQNASIADAVASINTANGTVNTVNAAVNHATTGLATRAPSASPTFTGTATFSGPVTFSASSTSVAAIAASITTLTANDVSLDSRIDVLESASVTSFQPGDTFMIQKDTVTGFWPASWTNKTPVYTGGSASAGVRPTSDATVTCIWKGADPSPAIVSSGTAGMRNNIDIRFVH